MQARTRCNWCNIQLYRFFLVSWMDSRKNTFIKCLNMEWKCKIFECLFMFCGNGQAHGRWLPLSLSSFSRLHFVNYNLFAPKCTDACSWNCVKCYIDVADNECKCTHIIVVNNQNESKMNISSSKSVFAREGERQSRRCGVKEKRLNRSAFTIIHHPES